MEGWIKIHRNLLNWQYANSAEHLAVFITLLLRANFKTSTWRGIDLMPGQIITGRKQLSDWTGIPECRIRAVLRSLRDGNEIDQQTTNKYSIITITNWDKYQQDHQQTTNKPPTNHQQTATSKNVKNVKKERTNIAEQNVFESPLNYLFSDYPEIKSWLGTGMKLIQEELLSTYEEGYLRETIISAYAWQVENKKRKAGTYLKAWIDRDKNKKLREEADPLYKFFISQGCVPQQL